MTMTIRYYFLSLMILLGLSLTQSVSAQTAPNTPAILDDTEKQAIRQIIQAQLDAFQSDDAETAFSFASPNIQARFGNSATFMQMVKTGYQAVYRPRALYFKEIIDIQGQIAQQVLILDQNEDTVLAIYPMERQQDGSWRIDGCFLKPPDKNQQFL